MILDRSTETNARRDRVELLRAVADVEEEILRQQADLAPLRAEIEAHGETMPEVEIR